MSLPSPDLHVEAVSHCLHNSCPTSLRYLPSFLSGKEIRGLVERGNADIESNNARKLAPTRTHAPLVIASNNFPLKVLRVRVSFGHTEYRTEKKGGRGADEQSKPPSDLHLKSFLHIMIENRVLPVDLYVPLSLCVCVCLLGTCRFHRHTTPLSYHSITKQIATHGRQSMEANPSNRKKRCDELTYAMHVHIFSRPGNASRIYKHAVHPIFFPFCLGGSVGVGTSH